MTRKTHTFLAAAVVLAVVLAAAWRLTASRERPLDPRELQRGWNVLLVSLDTTRPDRLAACGGGPVPTPGLDRIAGGGFVFTDAVTPVPVTLPAHASLFTGRNPNRHGVRENTEFALPPGTRTLAAAFRDAGYATAAFTAAFVMDARFGLDQGFDLYEDRLDGPEAGLGPATVELPGAIVTARAARWLSARTPSDPPFFLFVHYFDAHAPYAAPQPFATDWPDDPYNGELAYQDRCLGQLLDALEASGHAGRTVVWVVSDHGESLGEHGEAGHSLFVYDAALRAVSVLRLPPDSGRWEAAPPRLRLDAPSGLIDVAPTLLEIAGLPPASVVPPGGSLDGRSLVPLLRGAPAQRLTERDLYCETLSPFISYRWSPLYGVRAPGWKYIRAPIPELYDLEADPSEQTNLAAARPDRVAALSASLDGFLAHGEEAAARREPSGEELERLRSLGYLSGSDASTAADPRGAAADGAAAGEPLPDPKRMVGFYHGTYQQAKSLLYAGRYPEAAEAFREALRIDPLNNSMHLYLAGALRQAGRLDEAARSYEDALRIEPSSPRTWYGLGIAHYLAGRPDSAAWALRRSIELLPAAPEAWKALGAAEWSADRTASAAEAYAEAARLGDDTGAVRGALAALYRGLPGREAEARAHLEAYARRLGVPPEAAVPRLPQRPDPTTRRIDAATQPTEPAGD